MDSRKINYFLEVAREMSFTKASSKLFITQSALSQQISQLEKELDAQLFDRSKKRHLQLTDAGRLFYDFFSKQEEEFQSLLVQARRLGNNIQGNVKIGLIEGLDIVGHVMPFLRHWQELYPQVSVTMESIAPNQLVSRLLDGYFDAVIVFGFFLSGQSAVISDTLLYDSHYKILFSKNNPVAYSKHPQIKDFENQPVYVQEHPVLRRSGEKEVNILKRYGANPVLTYLPNHDTILAEVSTGIGYTFTHEWDRSCANSQFLTIDIPIKTPLYLAYRKDLRNQPAKRLIELLPQWFQENT